MDPNQQKRQQRLIILAVVVISIIIATLLFAFTPSRKNKNDTKVYTDPNNKEQIDESSKAEPENPEDKFVITGTSELINQGLSSNAVSYLTTFFTKYNKDIKYVSIVTSSIKQSRNKTDAFTYTFDVQIDKGEYYKVTIDTADSTTGTVKLTSKDGSKTLSTGDYSDNTPVDYGEEGNGD